MKTKITLILIFAMCYHVMAQQIATFETGSTTFGTITGAPADEQTEFVVGADNPDKTGLNTSDKCLYILSNQVFTEDINDGTGRPTWNGNVFYITFDTPLTIDAANRYLHILHWKESLLNNTWLVFAENGDENYIEIGRGNCPEAGKWFDMVVDFQGKLTQVKRIRVHLDGNWGTDAVARYYAPTKFYYDDIVLNSNSLPRAEFITRSNLLDFENSSITNQTVTMTVQNAAYTTNLSYTNPASSLNTSLSCAFFKGNTVKPLWWHGFHFTFKSPVDAGSNQYLHVMMKKDRTETQNVQVSLVNAGGTQTAALMNIPITTEWVDYVLTIPSTHSVFTQMYIKFNAATMDTQCFADEIYIDNSSAPRTTLTTAMNNAEKWGYRLYSQYGKIIFKTDSEKEINIFNIAGQKVLSQKTTNLEWYAPVKSVYIVRVNESVHKLAVE